MVYRCLDCGFKGKRFVSGACPACGSMRVDTGKTQEVSNKRKPIQLVLLLMLWAYLFYSIYTTLSS